MKMESMPKNIVDIMFELTKNDGLAMLLINNESKPFDKPVSDSDKMNMIKPNSEKTKIFPYPFDTEATVTDGSFIRVYYNDGDFNENEVIAESQIHIDIICAKTLWLINDGTRSTIRPYEIMGRIIDKIGKRSLNSTIKLKFEGYQHLYINQKFDAIRLYASYMSVET